MFSSKLSEIKKLLNIDDEYIKIHGLEYEERLIEENDIDIDRTDKLFFDKKDKKVKKPTDLKVKPVIKEDDDYIFINDNLPKIPFSLLSAGARGSGKSVITLWLIKNLKSYYDEIIIFSPTIELDYKYKQVFEDIGFDFEFGRNIFRDYDEAILTKILNKIKQANKNKPFRDKVRVLMVFDDIICSLPKQKRKSKFNKLLLNNRHYNISIIINSQSLKLFDSNFRKNCSQIILFRTDNQLELKNYYEEFAALLGNTTREQRENFMKLYYYATEQEHSFLYINTHNKVSPFFKNFDEQLNVKDIISKPLEYYSPF